MTEPAWNGYLLTVTCPCGVTFERWVTALDAELDLLRCVSLNSRPPFGRDRQLTGRTVVGQIAQLLGGVSANSSSMPVCSIAVRMGT